MKALADTMVLMLPRLTDNGARLAAILPTAIASLALWLDQDPSQATLGRAVPSGIPTVRSMLVIAVDGLGFANLKGFAGHARALNSLAIRRIETVLPSTTGAALTSLTTGYLPGEHGLIGYRIRHPQLGLITTLKDWDGIEDPRQWQRATPLFGAANAIGIRTIVIGRPAHAQGGLTEAILRGAEFHAGQRIEERFAIASAALRSQRSTLAYLYVDELDRAGHSEGWQSGAWVRRLEQLDEAMDGLLRSLPGDVGVVLTADHGMLDVTPEHQVFLDDGSLPLGGVEAIGGEPRLRSLYLDANTDAADTVGALQAALGKSAWVGTRDEAIEAGWFGPVADGVAQRLGEVLVAARGRNAFVLHSEDPASLRMVGQHGGLSDDERGVPLALGGALTGTSFAACVRELASTLPERLASKGESTEF